MIIFLDFDSPIATVQSYKISRNIPDAKCLCVLKYLVDKVGGEIVISSTWRRLHTIEELKEMLCVDGTYLPVIGVTPDLITEENEFFFDSRGEEITCWMKMFPDVMIKHDNKFVIIDDEISSIREKFSMDNIIHVKDGFYKGGLKMKMVDKYLSRLS